jgi:Tfp pilus assembly protein FimT
MVVMTLIGLVTAATLPRIRTALDGANTRGAAFYVSSRFTLARTLAAQRNANVAFRFEPEDDGFRVRTLMDTNGNGVLVAEVRSGVDVSILPDERLDHRFSGVQYGFVPGGRLIDGTSVSPGDDPIRVGRSDMLTFSPSGTATAGSVYIRSRRDEWQCAVIVLGATGRTRIARFDVRTRQWIDP